MPSEEDVLERLVGFEEDKKDIFHLRETHFKGFLPLIEAAFNPVMLTVSSDKKVDKFSSSISGAVINPIF